MKYECYQRVHNTNCPYTLYKDDHYVGDMTLEEVIALRDVLNEALS